MRRRTPLIACLAGLGFLAWSVVVHPWGWLYGFGVHPYPAGTPWTYQMWSGIIPALTVVSLLGSIAGAWHLHNCHYEGCWRLGKHRISGTPWCTHHMHLAVPKRSAEELLELILARLTPEQAPAHRRRW